MFCHFGRFFALLTTKNEKNNWRHYPFTHVYHRWGSLHGSWGIRWYPFFAILPSWKPGKSKFWKNEKMPGDIILLNMCNINDNHMYGSWDMGHDRQKCLSFWASFALLPYKQPKKLKFWKKEKMPGNIIILNMCTKNCDHLIYSSWDMVCNGQLDRQRDGKSDI